MKNHGHLMDTGLDTGLQGVRFLSARGPFLHVLIRGIIVCFCERQNARVVRRREAYAGTTLK